MCNKCDYTIHGRHHHLGWDNSFAPVERVAPGSTLEFECLDSSGGQLTAESTVDDVGRLDFALVNPVTGPIFVEGAQPGDALKITVESFTPSGFGWTANIPGFGLLADQFKEPAINIWAYEASTLEPALFGKNGRVPLKPFAGTMGNALAEPGHHSVVPPRRGRRQSRHPRPFWAGTTLYSCPSKCPARRCSRSVDVRMRRSSVDGCEVCGTAIESPDEGRAHAGSLV